MSRPFSQNIRNVRFNGPSPGMLRLVGIALLIFVVVLAGSQATYVVEPGHRGVRVTLGKVSPVVEGEGLLFKAPFISTIHPVSVRQQTEQLSTECYSSDLQQVKTQLRVLFRVPEAAVVKLFKEYEGEPFEGLVSPRVKEALKEAAALQSAEMIVQNREVIKSQTLEATRKKIEAIAEGAPLLVIEDIALSDIALSPELNAAIELKMTQKEEAERAKFVQRKVEIEAKTAVIKARGEAEAIQLRGEALRRNPAFIQLQILEKWDGLTPLVIGGDQAGANILVPLEDLKGKRP